MYRCLSSMERMALLTHYLCEVRVELVHHGWRHLQLSKLIELRNSKDSTCELRQRRKEKIYRYMENIIYIDIYIYIYIYMGEGRYPCWG